MLLTFPKGGIHPAENKLSVGRKIETLALPKQAAIFLSQHIGAPAVAVVKKGDAVKVGTLLASAGGFISACVYSPYSGTVLKIDEVADAAGFKRPAVIIEVAGDQWEPSIDRSANPAIDPNITPDQIKKAIQEAGIVGMGGATFPTQVKLSPPAGKVADILLINGVECEPYLTSDHALMMEHADEILQGVLFIQQALGVKRVVVGIESNKPDAIALFTQKAQQFSPIEIQPLQVKYPQGGEKQLIKAITGREVPSGGLPIEVGAVVQNVATAFAVYEAVVRHKPLVDRVVTVTGKSLSNPSNFLVRIGTPITQLIEAAGGLPEDTAKVVNGGPMMGKAMATLDTYTTKGTSGILLFNEREAQREEIENCIRCGRCVDACSFGIEPYLMATYSAKGMWEEAQKVHVMECCECGSCIYICPANRPLLDYIRLGKSKVGAIMRARNSK